MGKRKERRLAAMMGAGRRVKLDLFAEPPAELSGSSAHEELGEDVDAKLDAGSPKSPSTSGQEPANPLLLLGQYSDEELDEVSNKRCVDQECFVADKDKESKEHEVTTSMVEDPSSLKVTEQDGERVSCSGSPQTVEDNVEGDDNAATSGDIDQEINLGKSILMVSDSQITGDGISCWKMVMHQETNQYYYWNTVTGETSWEMPNALAQETMLTSMQETLLVEGKDSTAVFGVKPDGVSDEHGDKFGQEISATLVAYEHGPQIDQSMEGYGGDRNQFANGYAVPGALHQGTSRLGNYSSYKPPESTVVGGGSSAFTASETDVYGTMTSQLGETDLPCHLVKRCEHLLERLNSLRGSRVEFHQHAWISKYIIEIEIRLSDFKSLLPYGSSLFPFWVHSDTQIRRLEHTVDNELGLFPETEQKNESSTMHVPALEGKDAQDAGGQPEPDENRKDVKITAVVEKPSQNGISYDQLAYAEQEPVSEYPRNIGEDDNTKAEGTVLAHIDCKPEIQTSEVDMDVDMEVEDMDVSCQTTTKAGGKGVAPSNIAQPSHPIESELQLPGDEFVVPPPPDEEWIPPLPPENEGIPPPPPPDDLPEAFCPPPPPSDPESGQSVPYTTGYSLTYSDPNFTYYGGLTSETPGIGFYGHAEGCHVAVPNPQIYYETLPSLHCEEAAVMTNPVEPSLYYSLQNGVVSAAPIVATIESSSFHAASAPLTYDGPSSVHAGTVNAQLAVTSVPNTKIEVSGLGGGTEVASTLVPSTSSVVSASAALSSEGNVSVPSTCTLPASSSTIPGTSAVSGSSTVAAKGQSKASRSKKRTVAVVSSLKSNKKVSSLVDKWKAAKEELHEQEEEEPENALEILEKKRQREIEEWRAQQLASGEARDNANFQPLGGDWRERVKRRRAQKRTSVETSPDTTASENKQPDLTELSRDLPPGWQAYLDESSGQVYYGNALTSETSWSRPT